ncbi:MAG: M15 family metallopeptidase [Patescibacteria group bacterium]|nr:M15 family metallopeptidase [Patescibacteria group bacterium]
MRSIGPAWQWIAGAALAAAAVGSGVDAWYAHGIAVRTDARLAETDARLSALEADLSSTTAGLQSSIVATHASLANALSEERQNVGSLASQLGSYQQQFSTVSSTVSDLQKLQSIDPQLLEKYSKVYFLNENYMPAALAEIPDAYKYSDSKLEQVIPQVLPKLESMLDAASSSGALMYVASAYRSFDSQSNLKSQYTVVYGAGTANTFSADQGYSEHQLGTAVDLIAPGLGGQLDDRFAATGAYAWLTANAYRYGFTLSYPDNNPYYIYEPWHWRFVGVKLATYLHDSGKHLYDLDQRTIDGYLASIFD